MFLGPAVVSHISGGIPRQREILAEEVRLLYSNTNTAVAVTLIAASILGYLQWMVIPRAVVSGWWLYMALVATARFFLARNFPVAAPIASGWRAAFAVGAGLAGIGWGAAAVLLYPVSHLTHQVFLAFVLGGMMLGSASLLAPRPEAFLAFLLPTGLVPSVQMLMQGDETHVAMGALATLFTVATVVTTYRIHLTIDSSLRLQFENRDLVADLRAANTLAAGLNQELESRVEERTAELSYSNERLRAEIQHREQMEEELLRARKLESLAVLAGGIAHDFNNFLTVVQGNLELAKLEEEAGEPVRETLEQVARACRSAAFLSSQLLTFAKGGTPVRRVVSVAKLISDAVELARAGAPVTIDVNVAEDLRCALVDAGQIGQVLHNILLNARQAMPEGGIIEVRAENVPEAAPDASPAVRISIRDYGCGISADVLPRIFDPYFTTKPNGNGLGLATAYAIVRKHGGEITVNSTPGRGTVFHVVLPATGERPEPAPVTAAPLRTGTGRLLVMDDEEAVRKLLESVLSRLGYQVQGARDGAEAIALYEDAQSSGYPFDAVLLDLTVRGGMGGVEAASKMRELDPSARLIVSSGYADAPVLADFRAYGFDESLPKPWNAAALSEVFRRVLLGDAERKQ